MRFRLAERTGFGPAVGCPTRAFQARTLDHSDTSPYFKIIIGLSKLLYVYMKLVMSIRAMSVGIFS